MALRNVERTHRANTYQVINLVCNLVDSNFFFFFQAEDGIRDWSVTGVQTCALPISVAAARLAAAVPRRAGARVLRGDRWGDAGHRGVLPDRRGGGVARAATSRRDGSGDRKSVV